MNFRVIIENTIFPFFLFLPFFLNFFDTKLELTLAKSHLDARYVQKHSVKRPI